MNNKYTKYEIRPNDCCARIPCSICGRNERPESPIAIYDKRTERPVCSSCAYDHCPELFGIVSAVRYSEHRIREKERVDTRNKMDALLVEINAEITRILPLLTLKRYGQAETELISLQGCMEKYNEPYETDSDLPF